MFQSQKFPMAILTVLVLVSPSVHATYTLTDSYAGSTFFGNFTPFTAADPTNGFVTYTSYENATSSKLIGTVANANNAAYLGVDHTTTITTTTGGRPSTRIGSTKIFNKGLFIADIAHMPGEECGIWPAFWLVGPDWPNGGEIDIIEGVNAAGKNQMTLHTSQGCSIAKSGYPMTGSVQTTACNGDAPGQDKNVGCAVQAATEDSFGAGFNAAGGGVYATEWTSNDILIWFFPRGKIPADVASASPDPTKWGTPTAHFCGECDIDAHFKDMQLVFDTTFCGDWAGKAWSEGSCKSKAPTCEAYVGQNPGAFEKAFWLVNKVEVFADASLGTETGTGTGKNQSLPVVKTTKATQRRSRSVAHRKREMEEKAEEFVGKEDVLEDELTV